MVKSFSFRSLVFAVITILGLTSQASFFPQTVPDRPTDAQHPGSSNYAFTVQRESIKLNGRQVDTFLPVDPKNPNYKAPVIVFGHGQAIGVEGYETTFRHLAQKGIAVIHPMFDTGFFDQDWRRMAKDFNDLAQVTLEKYSSKIDADQTVYAGHSKGGYIALMAAGAPNNRVRVRSLVLFAPAGYDADYLKALNPDIPVTLAWSDGDTVIKQNLITEIYSKLTVRNKQWILVKSYESLKADHFFPLNKSYFFGGRDGESPLHYFASWKWLVSAAFDVQQNSTLTNPYIYGDQTQSTGVDSLKHTVTRNW